MVINLAGLLIVALQIYSAVDCFKSNMESNKKILWIVLIVLMPLIGSILYFLLGRKV
jgi:hypothetical protein